MCEKNIFYLVIDESGSKGYSTKTENSAKEFGVMVGFLIPQEFLLIWRVKSEEHFDFAKDDDEKKHITSLSREEQTELRFKLFTIFKTSGVNWFYQGRAQKPSATFLEENVAWEKPTSS